jgi:IS4 transposase
MQRLQDFQIAARNNGFVDVQETVDGTVLWMRKPTADAEDRLCIDSLTNSATVFWASKPWKINSKTFRAASALQDWFAAASRQAAPTP